MRNHRGRVLIVLLLTTAASAPVAAQCTGTGATDVLTGQYNSYRSGANLRETILTPSNVKVGQFGYLFSISVDSAPVFAQPLVAHNLTIRGTAYCTVVFVATMDNFVYAFDGDNTPGDSSPYIWKSAQFGTPVPYEPYSGFTSVGIMGTPVIDLNHQILYLVSLAQEGSGTAGWTYRLHALSITTGTEFFPADQTSPGGVVISGSVPGTGDNSANGTVPLIPSETKQRVALLDVSGTIYISFGWGNPGTGREYTAPYHGWSLAYKSCVSGSTTCATDPPCFSGSGCGLQQISILNMTPNSHGGGIWMSGRGPAYDGAGNVFLSVGNGCALGSNPVTCGPEGFSESVLNVTNLDFFVPSIPPISTLDYNDLDLDAGGLLLIPPGAPPAVSSYLVAGGKTGALMLLKTTGLTGQSGNPYQQFQATGVTAECPNSLPVYDQTPLGRDGNTGACDEYHHPAYWSKGSSGYLYIWGQSDILRAYSFNTTGNELFDATPVATYTPATLPGNGGILAVSADETAYAILWAVTANADLGQGALSAFRLWNANADTPVLSKLWDSSAEGTTYFAAQRFTSPVVSNGKVYVPTPSTDVNGNTQIMVYGLCSDVSGGCQSVPTHQYLFK
jgi:hypothetical protein